MEDELIVDGSVAQEGSSNTDAETEIEPVIYTGPNIFALALQKFQVFKGGLPPYVKRAIEKIPEIKSLIVPVSELEAMRAKIEKSGTLEARIFYDVQKEAEKLRTKGKVKK
ncbi:MAG: hypothetical protein IKN30_04165 [Synergistaceae bacterium]|nr:hypothetical protein [Synergistaceae bacterium]